MNPAMNSTSCVRIPASAGHLRAARVELFKAVAISILYVSVLNLAIHGAAGPTIASTFIQRLEARDSATVAPP